MNELVKRKIIPSVNYGFEKITFSGGEPTLCHYLPELLKIAKVGGMTTCIVTNGSMLNKQWLNDNKKYLDWIAISIDSVDLDTNIKSGRFNKKNGLTKEKHIELIQLIKRLGFKLKINTVVSSYNKKEDLSEFLNIVKPLRWKVFQALPIDIQNDEYKHEFMVTDHEFNDYLNRHKDSPFIKESNHDMKGSYIMIDPIGRFFENAQGIHKYSSKIISVGVKKALSELDYCFDKFINRDGLYVWK